MLNITPHLGNVNQNHNEISPHNRWDNHYIKNRIKYDPAIPRPVIYPNDLKSRSQREICIPLLIAALFTIANKRKQPKYLLTDEW